MAKKPRFTKGLKVLALKGNAKRQQKTQRRSRCTTCKK